MSAPTCSRCGTGKPYDVAVGWVSHGTATFCSWACVNNGVDGQPRAVHPALTVPVDLFEARVEEYRLELAKKQMQLVRYRLLLEQHGIEPPDSEGQELLSMWKECRHVMTTASQFVMKLGTGKELLVDWSAQ